MMNIRQALARQEIFASAIADPTTFAAWFAFLAALFGLPMSESEAETFTACTGRVTLPTTPFNEAWLVCGRRAGKSFMMALSAVYLAVFSNYRDFLGAWRTRDHHDRRRRPQAGACRDAICARAIEAADLAKLVEREAPRAST